MKATTFYNVTFLAFLFVGKFFNDIVNYFICQLSCYRQYGKISQPQAAHI